MSLKSVHLAFIIAAILLAAWMTVWCVSRYAAEGSTGMLIGAMATGLAGVGLVVYLFRFLKKFKNVRYY